MVYRATVEINNVVKSGTLDTVKYPNHCGAMWLNKFYKL